MKINTRLTAFLLAAVILITGCASSNNGTSSVIEDKNGTPAAKITKEEKKGGKISFALATSPDSLDPHRSGLAVAVRVLRTLYDSLVVQDTDGQIKPWLATSWEISEDRKSYTFKLREDVKFHDGTPFNAEAVKYSYDRILDPNTKAANSTALIAPYESSEVIDEYTIKLNLSTPSESFLANLSQALVAIVSPTAAKQYGDDFLKNPVGSGPFKFVSWTENAEIVVERNDEYNWGPETLTNQGVAYLDQIVFKIVPEEATRIGSVQSKQVDAAETVPPQNIVQLESDASVNIHKKNTVGLPYTLFINLNHEPWNELEARQALQYGIDVGAIVKTLYLGTYDQAWSPLTPGILGYDASLEGGIEPNVEKANQLLEGLGWIKGDDGIRVKDGKRLTLKYVDGTPNREKRNDIALIVQQQLKEVGIEVAIEITKDIRTVVYTNYDYDLYGNSQVNADPNSLYSFYHSWEEGKTVSLSKLRDSKIDALLEQGRIESDIEKRKAIYSEIQHYIIDQAIIIPIYVFPYTIAANTTVEQLEFDALGYPIFNSVYVNKK